MSTTVNRLVDMVRVHTGDGYILPGNIMKGWEHPGNLIMGISGTRTCVDREIRQRLTKKAFHASRSALVNPLREQYIYQTSLWESRQLTMEMMAAANLHHNDQNTCKNDVRRLSRTSSLVLRYSWALRARKHSHASRISWFGVMSGAEFSYRQSSSHFTPSLCEATEAARLR